MEATTCLGDPSIDSDSELMSPRVCPEINNHKEVLEIQHCQNKEKNK